MRTTFFRLVHLSFLLVALACSSSLLLAQDDGGDEGESFAPPEDEAVDAQLIPGEYSKVNWPTSELERPITLSKGLLEIIQASKTLEFRAKTFDFASLSILPKVHFGVSDKLEIPFSVQGSIGIGALFSVANKLDGGLTLNFVKEFAPPADSRELILFSNIRLLSNSSSPKRAVGISLTMVSRGYSIISVSRDSGITWQPDTVGSLGGYPYDIAIDTLDYLYYANSKGLFKHHRDTLVWNKISSFPATNALSVFADRKNRLFASSFSKTYMSTNSGSTWTLDTAGVYGFTATKYCDDVFGNIYALSSNKLYRSLGGTQPWERIDQPISSLAVDQNISTLFNSINGDSIVVTATAFGVFQSRDQGITWTPMKTGLRAGPIYGLVKTTDGKLITSTNLGIYSHTAGGGPWSKIYPTSGYASGRPIYQDASHNFYTLGPKIDYNNLQSFWMNLKSTDGGATWNPDTAGIGSFRKSNNYSYSVDETGTQHYMMADSIVPIYSKSNNQAWLPDTNGFSKKGLQYATTFGSDRRGNFYVATNNLTTYKGMLWKRPINGGTWGADTNGLNGEQIYSLTVDKSGKLIAGTYNGIYLKTGGVWSKLSYPSGLDGNNAFVVSVDSSGALLAGFSSFSGFSASWHGVYSTTNSGATWKYVGLDSVAIRQLVSYGDTTYAATYARGLYKFTRFGITGVEKGNSEVPKAFILEQNYPNPFNPTTTINYQVPINTMVSLMVYDVLGRKVVMLVNEKKDAGKYRVQFNASKLSSGVYFYRLQSGSYGTTKKFVLLK